MSLTVSDHRVIYHNKRFHAAFPSIIRFSDGHLLLAFRRARDARWLVTESAAPDYLDRMDHMDSRSHIVLIELDESGNTMDNRLDILPMDPEAADQCGNLMVLPDDRVFISSFSWYPFPVGAEDFLAGRPSPEVAFSGTRFIYWGAHTSLRGRAYGEWLTDHRYIQPDGSSGRWMSPDAEKPLVDAVGGRACRVNGKLLLAVYGNAHSGCGLFKSDDDGESWQFKSVIAKDDSAQLSYQEPALCEDGKGGLVCFMRTAGANGRLATSKSEDGVHWSEPKLHQLVGHPFHPLPLADGRLFLSYGYRAKPFGIRARILDSALSEPDDAEEIIIRDDGLCPDLGYPWTVELKDGRLLLVYYWTDEKGIRQIVGSWLNIDTK